MKFRFDGPTSKDRPEPSKIGIKCLECNDEIFSHYTHDFKECKCKSCYIDGGNAYTRVGGNPNTFKYIRYDRQEIK